MFLPSNFLESSYYLQFLTSIQNGERAFKKFNQFWKKICPLASFAAEKHKNYFIINRKLDVAPPSMS